jgi:hypothetical protein
MTHSQPVALRLIVRSLGGGWRDYVRTGLAVLEENGFGPIERWEIPALDCSGKGAPDAVVEELSRRTDELDESTYLDLLMPDDTVATVQPARLRQGDGFSLRLVREFPDGADSKTPLAFLAGAAAVCRGLAAETEAVWAKLIPIGGGATCIPDPPLVEANSHVVLTSEPEVEENYDAPQAFWDSGWESIESFGTRRLLLRGMDAVAGAQYLEKIIGQQWQLARAAKPRRTAYALPQPEPSELPIFRAGRSQLEFVGYQPGEEAVEYSCTLAKGDQIPGWEIYELWDLLQEGKLKDGRPIKTVRVVFLEEWAAKQEKRPLLDIGCRVFHYDDDGELRELTD